MNRFGPSTLIEVGAEKFLFDAGRGAMQRLFQLRLPFGDITGMFLTHLHSDHLVGFADLWLTGWIGRPWGKRSDPLKLWGPEGTGQFSHHLPLAFATDIRVRSHSYSDNGVELDATEIGEGVAFEEGGVKITAFKVDHGGEQLIAFGYRIDYRGRSAVLSGDTTFNQNVIKFSQGTDVLIHEVVYGMGGGMGGGMEKANLERITSNHTSPDRAGEVFAQAKPRLAVYTHLLFFGDATADDLIPATRPTYDGPLIVGKDLMQIDIGEEIQVNQFAPGPDAV